MRIPRPPITAAGREARGSSRDQLAYGFRFLRQRPGLFRLALFFFAQNFYIGVVIVLLTPMVLGFADTHMLGIIFPVGGIGFLVGSVLMAAWGGPRRRVAGILGLLFVQGCLMLLGAWQPSAVLVGAGAFGILLTEAIIGGCHTAIWRRQVPIDVQGRVLGIRTMLSAAGLALAFLGAGPFNDRLFEPWMAADGLLSSTVGRVLGTGTGRGTALLFVTCGLLAILTAIVVSLDRRIRCVDDETEVGEPGSGRSGPRSSTDCDNNEQRAS